MLLTLMMNLNMFGGVAPPIMNNVPIDYIEEKGGSDGKKLSDGIHTIQKDDEEILLLIAQWIAQKNNK